VARPRRAQNDPVPKLGRFACLLLLAACGLVPPDPIGFRSYPLKDTALDEAIVVVNDVTRRFALERFGGIGLAWDPLTRNLVLDPVFDGRRRMKLFIHVEPAGADTNVEMFALVEHLHADANTVGWTEPMQDVPLEEALYQAYVAELVARREAAR
jgi:hypothetical protein